MHYILIAQKSTREAMHVQRNTIARSRKHWCRGTAIRITYSECVSVALLTQHAKRMRRTYIVTRG